MKIDLFKDITTRASSVNAGDCFLSKGLLYMRVRNDAGVDTIMPTGHIPVVLLSTGAFEFLNADTTVEKVDCTVINTLKAPQVFAEKDEKDKWDV